MYYADFTPPPTTRQMNFARLVAMRLRDPIPDEVKQDRAALSRWIDARKTDFADVVGAQTGGYGGTGGATSRQVNYAERIARARRRAVPEECYRSAALMSRWIDANR